MKFLNLIKNFGLAVIVSVTSMKAYAEDSKKVDEDRESVARKPESSLQWLVDLGIIDIKTVEKMSGGTQDYSVQ